jgi:hypothetical protein
MLGRAGACAERGGMQVERGGMQVERGDAYAKRGGSGRSGVEARMSSVEGRAPSRPLRRKTLQGLATGDWMHLDRCGLLAADDMEVVPPRGRVSHRQSLVASPRVRGAIAVRLQSRR